MKDGAKIRVVLTDGRVLWKSAPNAIRHFTSDEAGAATFALSDARALAAWVFSGVAAAVGVDLVPAGPRYLGFPAFVRANGGGK